MPPASPRSTATIGTISGATMAPTLEPELKMPVANARSRAREPLGDGLDRGREIAGFAEAEREARDREARDAAASAWLIAARLHTPIASA